MYCKDDLNVTLNRYLGAGKRPGARTPRNKVALDRTEIPFSTLSKTLLSFLAEVIAYSVIHFRNDEISDTSNGVVLD